MFDDAIREHLELKRSKGADKDDLARLEREAFGPAKREQPATPADEAAEAPPADTRAGAPQPDERASAPPVADPEATQAFPQQAQPEPAQPTVFEDDEPVDWLDSEPEERGADPREDEARAAFERQAAEIDPDRPADDATESWAGEEDDPETGERQGLGDQDVVHDDWPSDTHLPAPVADDEDDVLEETPEFLKDSPDQDQLWFEQNPPKDFDFDEE